MLNIGTNCVEFWWWCLLFASWWSLDFPSVKIHNVVYWLMWYGFVCCLCSDYRLIFVDVLFDVLFFSYYGFICFSPGFLCYKFLLVFLGCVWWGHEGKHWQITANRHFFQVSLQLYSRGSVDPVPDSQLLRKYGSASNGTQDLWICSQRRSHLPNYMV
jgi:hypothetical protein